ncbi:hypothetical protein ACLOJK_019029 [Asimina triloba]
MLARAREEKEMLLLVRVVNGVPPTGDYSFAKYNKLVDVLKYTDEEYKKYLTDPSWTKEETDQLFDLCQLIADMFPTCRSVEELKSRYYAGAVNVCVTPRSDYPSERSGSPSPTLSSNSLLGFVVMPGSGSTAIHPRVVIHHLYNLKGSGSEAICPRVVIHHLHNLKGSGSEAIRPRVTISHLHKSLIK